MLRVRGSSFKKVAVAVLIVAFFASACSRSQQEAEASEPDILQVFEQVNYKTVTAEVAKYERTGSSAAGVMYPVKTVMVWEKANSYCAEVLVSGKQEVKKGDILMRFEVEVDHVTLETLKLQLQRETEELGREKEKRQAAIAEAKSAAEALQEQVIYEKEIALLKVERMQAEYDAFVYQSQRTIQLLQEQIAELRRTAEENVLVAPHDGIVELKTVLKPGDKVTPGQELLTVYATDKFLLKVNSASKDLKYNMDVQIQAGDVSNLMNFDGHVVVAANVLPASFAEDVVLIELDGQVPEKDFKNNKILTQILVNYSTDAFQNVLMVDVDALHSENGKLFVNVLEEDTVHKRYVFPVINNGKQFWILDGVTEGQALIID